MGTLGNSRKIYDDNLTYNLSLNSGAIKKLREFATAQVEGRTFSNISQLAKFTGKSKIETQRIWLARYNAAVDNAKMKVSSNKKTLKVVTQLQSTNDKEKAIKKLKKIVKLVPVKSFSPEALSVVTKSNGVRFYSKNEQLMSRLKSELMSFAGKSVVVEYIVPKKAYNSVFKSSNGQILDNAGNNLLDDAVRITKNQYTARSKQYDIPANITSSWWSAHSKDWWISSEETIFDAFNQAGNLYVYPEVSNITATKVIQSFRDGVTHCVFTPIRKWAQECFENSKSKQAKSTYNTMLKQLDEFESIYSDGLPETDIPIVCNTLRVDINIDLPFGDEHFIDCKSIAKRRKMFNFLNSRINHIELNELVRTDNEFDEVSKERIAELKEELIEQKSHFIFHKNFKNISSISTLTKQYKIRDIFRDIASKFELDTGLKFCKIDDMDDRELSSFIKDATNYNETTDFNGYYPEFDGANWFVGENQLHHIDQKNAYTKFKMCKFYEGFLGKITDFRQTDRIIGVGIYLITDIVIPDGPLKAYNDVMKIYLDNNSYTSAELKMLLEYGVSFRVVAGCWGVEPVDFDFPEEMVAKDDENIWMYAKWVGCCDSHNLKKQFWMTGDADFCNVLQSYHSDKVVRCYNNKEICIEFPKKHNYHLGHITAFILSYQRINVLEQLMTMEVDKIVRICVDGIYYIGDEVDCKNAFRPKEDKMNFNNQAGISYVSGAYERELIIPGWEFNRPHNAKELHLGAGGCGKTHMNIEDKGLQRVLYLAPSWKLARAKQVEYSGLKSSVWARSLSTDPERINLIKETANVLLVDEVSMLSNNQKLQLFETYKDMKIIMCGDIGYQLPCIEGTPITTEGFDIIVEHKTNHRTKCPILAGICKELRELISSGLPKEEINEWCLDKFKSLGRVINAEQLKEMYSINDMILSGTKEIKNVYTNMFLGKFGAEEKYIVTDNNRLYSRGDIVIGPKPEGCKCEATHCFTTHSIQGETANYNLFIDSSRMFDSRMFYTAISRARYLSQIYILEGIVKVFKYEFGKIYKISSSTGVYIGSTINPLEKRFSQHKSDCANYKNGKGKYVTSFAVLDGDNLKIEKIEDFKCDDLKDLWKREAEIIAASVCVNKTYKEEK